MRQSKEDGKDFCICLRGCIYFCVFGGRECIIKEVTFEQIDEELSRVLSGGEDRARSKAMEWGVFGVCEVWGWWGERSRKGHVRWGCGCSICLRFTLGVQVVGKLQGFGWKDALNLPFCKKKFYLVMPSLSCSMRDLQSSLWHVVSLVAVSLLVACKLLVEACGV